MAALLVRGRSLPSPASAGGRAHDLTCSRHRSAPGLPLLAAAHRVQDISRKRFGNPGLARQSLAVERIGKQAHRVKRALDTPHNIRDYAGIGDQLPLDEELDEDRPYQLIIGRTQSG